MKFIFLIASALCMVLPLEGSSSLSEISAKAEKALLPSRKQSNPSAAAASGFSSLQLNTIASSPSNPIAAAASGFESLKSHNPVLPKGKSPFEDLATVKDLFEYFPDNSDKAEWAITPVQREILRERKAAGLDTTSNEAIQSMRDEAREKYLEMNLAAARPLIPKSNLRVPASEMMELPSSMEAYRNAQENTKILEMMIGAGPATQKQRNDLASALVDELNAAAVAHEHKMNAFPDLKAEYEMLRREKETKFKQDMEAKAERATLSLIEKKKKEALIAQRVAN